jgi:4'-phosphopantetheinyl transferase EntD
MTPADSSRRPARAGLIASLLPAAVAASESTGSAPADPPGLFPAEEAALRTAEPRRRAEFAAGRSCARAALGRLGVPAGPILPGPAGQPQWPTGITGSITHCAGYQACAVARTTDVAAIGIDAEPDAELPAGLIETVATGTERAWISRHTAALPPATRASAAPPPAASLQAAPHGVCWDRLLFSAKESACKLWYPLTGHWPGFREVTIGLATTGTFTACLPGPGPAAGDRPVTRMTGRWLARDGLIVTAITWAP